MADPYDTLMNSPEWQAYEKKVGPAEAKKTMRQVMEMHRAESNTLAIPGATGATMPAATSSGMRTYSRRKPIMPELARKAKMHDEAQHILAAATELQDLYNNRIKPKIDSGQISPVGQGLDYTQPSMMRAMGGQQDPDVAEFITKSGAFSQMVNAYYSAGSGGRAGVGAYQVITSPHIPHPPASATEVLGLNPFSHQQWDLQKQGEQLPQIIDYVKMQEGMRGPKSYAPTGGPATAGTVKSLDEKAKALGVDW